jgi:hypothetical protein
MILTSMTMTVASINTGIASIDAIGSITINTKAIIKIITVAINNVIMNISTPFKLSSLYTITEMRKEQTH